MRRLLALALAVLALLPPFASLTGRAAESQEAAFDGYLVRLKEDVSGERLSLLAADDCQAVRQDLWLVEELETAQALEELGLAAYYEPNYQLELLEGEYQSTQWSLLAVDAQAAWNHTDETGRYDTRGDGVAVAVIDSGIEGEHPDLNGANILDCCNLAGAEDGVDGWHGTFVAGVLAAQVGNGLGTDGVAPNITLLPICITKSGYSTTALLIQAIDCAIEQGADVINLSIGGKTGGASMREACQRALDAGIILVAAAGNYKAGEYKRSTTYMYPAGFDGVAAVSACMQAGDQVVFDESYSYFNDQITVAAPGTAIQSLYPGGGTAVKEGTSFAAPVVTAMAAMAKQRSDAITPEAFLELLCSSALDLGEPGYDLYYGYGLADIGAFVEALDQQYPITFHLGGADAAFGAETEVPQSYVLGQEDLPLPEPVRPGWQFAGWYETADCSGQPAAALPAGSVGAKDYYAAWEPLFSCYFAQYDAAGQLLAVIQLPPEAEELPEDVTPLDDTVLGKLFWLDSTGAPVRKSLSLSLSAVP